MTFSKDVFKWARRIPWRETETSNEIPLIDQARSTGVGAGTEEEAAFFRLISGTREVWEIGVDEIRWHARYVSENLKDAGLLTIWDVLGNFPEAYTVRGVGPGTWRMLEMIREALAKGALSGMSAEESIQQWMRVKTGELPSPPDGEFGKSDEDGEVR